MHVNNGGHAVLTCVGAQHDRRVCAANVVDASRLLSFAALLYVDTGAVAMPGHGGAGGPDDIAVCVDVAARAEHLFFLKQATAREVRRWQLLA